jgi:AraC-like DNA-binding protein
METAVDPGPSAPGKTTASVTYHLPHEALRGCIATYYLVEVDGPGRVNDQIFPEWPNFRLVLTGAWEAIFPDQPDVQPVPEAGVTGTLERAVKVSGTAGLMVGVGLMPQGWARLTGKSAHGFTNCQRPLADALGPEADDLLRRLRAATSKPELYEILDSVLLPRLAETPPPGIGAAHEALHDTTVRSVTDWAAALALSPRQLERLSLRYFGLSPKRLLRRQRLLRTLADMRNDPDGTWSQSLDVDYTDQSHFIREFQYYMGMSPTAYLAWAQPFMAEAWKRRKELLGAPVQVLQKPSSSA